MENQSNLENNQCYPQIEINLGYLRENVETVVDKCSKQGINVAGVIKGASGIPECAMQFEKGGCKYLASSRLDQIQKAEAQGCKLPKMLIRLPMLSDIEDVIRHTDYSLNSELEVIKALNDEAGRQGRTHGIILMVDLGDLREGYWDKDELVSVSEIVENEMDNLVMAGIGTNLGCYGSILATKEKLQELADLAERVEAHLGRELEIVSGGATTSYMRVLDGNMPKKINHLRIGEQIYLSRDLREFFGYSLPDMHSDVFTLKAEIIEVKDKPTHPVGEISIDAFGRKPVYEDRGIRRRALAAIGKVDYADFSDIFPREDGVKVIGASSDHTILDVEEASEIAVGDILSFDIDYASLVYLTNCPDVRISLV